MPVNWEEFKTKTYPRDAKPIGYKYSTDFDIDIEVSEKDKYGNDVLGMDAYNEADKDPEIEILSRAYATTGVKQIYVLRVIEWRYIE